MKVEALIEKLKTFPPGTEVCVFDWRQNLSDDSGDGSGKGVHSDFEVELYDLLGPDEKEYYKEREGKEFVPWISISIENDDYDDGGEPQ